MKDSPTIKNVFRVSFIILILLELPGLFGAPLVATDFTWLGLIATAVVIWGALELLKTPTFLWPIAFIATVLDSASSLFGLYSRIDSWDVLVHTWGGMLVGAWALELILRGMRNGELQVRHKTLFTIIGTLLIMATVGFLYEFWEYLVDRFQYGEVKSLVSVYNSIEDQLFNLFGTALVVGGYYLLPWARRKFAGRRYATDE